MCKHKKPQADRKYLVESFHRCPNLARYSKTPYKSHWSSARQTSNSHQSQCCLSKEADKRVLNCCLTALLGKEGRRKEQQQQLVRPRRENSVPFLSKACLRQPSSSRCLAHLRTLVPLWCCAASIRGAALKDMRNEMSVMKQKPVPLSPWQVTNVLLTLLENETHPPPTREQNVTSLPGSEGWGKSRRR